MDTNIFLWQSDRWCTCVEPGGNHNDDGGDHNHNHDDDYDDDGKYGYD